MAAPPPGMERALAADASAAATATETATNSFGDDEDDKSADGILEQRSLASSEMHNSKNTYSKPTSYHNEC